MQRLTRTQLFIPMSYSFLFLVFSLLCTSAASASDYRLPFDGRWFVVNAGDTINVNPHMSVTSQWYGMDLMKTRGGSIVKGNGETFNDYYSWEQPVLSPVNGLVRIAIDGFPDNPIGVRDETNSFGNYVVIEVGPNEFVYLAHLQQGSIMVKEGDRVEAGQLLGKCGNSGNSTGPHIHMHVQDRLAPDTGTGLNVSFNRINVLLSGKQFNNVDWPLIRGLFVWHKE